MKIFALTMQVLASVNGFATMTAEAESVLRDGAVGKYVYRVVDDKGSPVPDASAHVWFRSYGRPQDKADWVIQTDTNGMFSAEHRFNEQFSVGIDKEGYYHTHVEINYLSMLKLPVKGGKWQPYGETRTVVLKRIMDPWMVTVFDREQCHRKIPAFGQWLGFDMERSDWLEPHGRGVHNDVLLRFERKVTDKWYEFAYSMEACFTNNLYAGVCRRPMDESSDLKTDYAADTNANYLATYRFTIESEKGKRVKVTGLEKDAYLVFRTRTRVDENGRLVGAHYGKYSRSWRSDHKEMHFGGGCFNPVENDSNIEGDQALLNAIKNYKSRKR